jgi:radical SAM protein with 4Fe4S-binding SPASM domain
VLSKALSGLERVVEIKKRLESETVINFRTVVMKQNEHELQNLERLAREVGADRFTIKSLNPSCGSTDMDTELLPKNLKYRRFKYKPGTFERIRIDKPCPRPWMMANIMSNGDVVPCTYDYDSSMKLGNIREQPLTEIWNGATYVEFRKKLSNDRQSFEKCRNCWINFKLSKSGWFPKSIDLHESASNRLKRNINEFIRKGSVGKVLKAVCK